MSGKKRKGNAAHSSDTGPGEDLDNEDDDEATEIVVGPDLEPAPPPPTPSEILARNTDPQGRAVLGALYRIKKGDTPIGICREALFGTREGPMEPWMWQAARDLLVRIDCGPWNQALYAVPLDEMMEGHAEIDSYFTKKGVSFYPVYKDNEKRILAGLPPTSSKGGSHAFLWIPMINLDILDKDGVVTTEGMNYPDTEEGLGGSMIDPPPEVINFGFEEVSGDEVGCDLPEGDFRRSVVQG